MRYTLTYMSENPEIKALFDAGAHIGYGKARRHPKMDEYIFGIRNNVEIFDLDKTFLKLKEAREFLKSLGKEGKMVLWVGTKPAASKSTASTGERLGAPYVAKRWLGGTITNFKVIGERLAYLDKLENDEKTGGFAKYLKKERLLKETELRKMSITFKGIRNLKTTPDAIVIVDPGEELAVFREAGRKNIPVIGLLNSDCNPEGVKYVIPANDNSSAAISVILDSLSAAYETGRGERAKV